MNLTYFNDLFNLKKYLKDMYSENDICFYETN